MCSTYMNINRSIWPFEWHAYPKVYLNSVSTTTIMCIWSASHAHKLGLSESLVYKLEYTFGALATWYGLQLMSVTQCHTFSVYVCIVSVAIHLPLLSNHLFVGWMLDAGCQMPLHTHWGGKVLSYYMRKTVISGVLPFVNYYLSFVCWTRYTPLPLYIHVTEKEIVCNIVVRYTL